MTLLSEIFVDTLINIEFDLSHILTIKKYTFITNNENTNIHEEFELD